MGTEIKEQGLVGIDVKSKEELQIEYEVLVDEYYETDEELSALDDEFDNDEISEDEYEFEYTSLSYKLECLRVDIHLLVQEINLSLE